MKKLLLFPLIAWMMLASCGDASENASEEASSEEGCLSLPGVLIHVSRPLCVRIKGLDEHGETAESISSDQFARVWQHEFDHLDGVLIVDRMSPKDRLVHRRTLKEMRAAFETSNGV